MSIKQIFTIAILAIVAITMTACGFNPPKDNPDTNASIYGNGGMEVRKGDYVYFINGYYGIDSVSDGTNSYGDVVRGGIYRTKLVDGNIQYDEDGYLVDCQVIVPKIVGYEFGSFFIYDDYIYYATPNDEKDRYGELQKNLVDIYRCDIDGDHNTRLYTTTAEYSSVSFNVTKIKTGDNSYSTFVMIKDGTSLVTIEFVNGKNQGEETIAEENVGTVAWLTQTNYINDGTIDSGDVSDVNKCIYYTETKSNTASSTALKSYNLVTKETKTLADDNISTYNLKGLKNNKLYYEKAARGSTTFNYNVLNSSFTSGETAMYYNSYSSYYIMNEENDYRGGVLAVGESGTYYVPFGSNGASARQVISADTAYDILFVNGSKVYVRNDAAQIYEIDLTDSTYTAKEILNSEATAQTSGSSYVDFDGRYIVYYAGTTVGESTFYYTHFVDTTEVDENDLYVDKFVGVYAEDEDPIAEEKENEENNN